MGGFMPSSRLVLRQWLVYTAHDPKDFASEPSSLESLITGNLPAQLNYFSNKVFKGYSSSTRLRWSPCGDLYEMKSILRWQKKSGK